MSKISWATRGRLVGAAMALVGALALGACASQQEASLYDRLGGKEAIHAVVTKMINNIVADDRINSFFSETDPEVLRAQLVDQICEATGGPCVYEGADMRTAHAGMGVTDAHFDAMVEDLIAAMNELGVPQKEQDELLGLLGPMRGDIVGV